jgi:hypothetical protein
MKAKEHDVRLQFLHDKTSSSVDQKQLDVQVGVLVSKGFMFHMRRWNIVTIGVSN